MYRITEGDRDALHDVRNKAESLKRCKESLDEISGDYLQAQRLTGMPHGGTSLKGLESIVARRERAQRDYHARETIYKIAVKAARKAIERFPAELYCFAERYYIEALSVQECAQMLHIADSTAWRYKKRIEEKA